MIFSIVYRLTKFNKLPIDENKKLLKNCTGHTSSLFSHIITINLFVT